jgi:hypothetical protein
MFFGNGRRPLLDFLRNLTPQILFLAFALIAGSKLDLNKVDISYEGVKRTALFAVCLFVFFASVLANLTTFLEDSLAVCIKKDEEHTNAAAQTQGLRRIKALLAVAWKDHKLAIFRMFIVMTVAEVAMSAVIFMGVQSAIVSPFFAK